MDCSTSGFPAFHYFLEFAQTHVHLVYEAIEPSSVAPFSSCLQSFPTFQWVFSNGSALLIRWPKYWSFSFTISPSNEHPGPISFRMDCLDLLAVQGTLKSLLQHHSSKASILLHSAFSNQSILKEISPEYSLQGLMLKLKLQYFGHLIQTANLLEKTLLLRKIKGRRRRGQQRMVGWHH